MHGFSRRTEVGAVLEWIDRHALRLGREQVSLDEASGRVLAEQVIASIDVPAFDRAAMDGYALHGDESSGATDYNPLAFAVLGQALPGQPFEGPVLPTTAVRVMTGAAMPLGADAVVPAEYAQEKASQVEITLAVSPGKHIGRRAEDIRAGSPVLDEGRRLRPQDLGLLASLGIAKAWVVDRPRVRIIVTGNEVVNPGEPKGLYQIFDANSAMLRGLVASFGAPVVQGVLGVVLGSTGGMLIEDVSLFVGAVLRAVPRRQRGSRATASRRGRRARHSWRRDAAFESRRSRSHRRYSGVPPSRQSRVLSLRLRLLCRARHPPARRAARGLAASHAARYRCPQDRSDIGRVDHCRVALVNNQVEARLDRLDLYPGTVRRPRIRDRTLRERGVRPRCGGDGLFVRMTRVPM